MRGARNVCLLNIERVAAAVPIKQDESLLIDLGDQMIGDGYALIHVLRRPWPHGHCAAPEAQK